MLAAMATFGFAHKSIAPGTPQQQPTSPPHMPQPAGIAMPAQLQDTDSGSSSFTSKLSRSLLSTAVHNRQQQPGRGSQAAGQMVSAQGAISASLMLGGPVAAAAAREGLQAPVPGPDKVSQQQRVVCSWYCSNSGSFLPDLHCKCVVA
jgi:hypothetical protein